MAPSLRHFLVISFVERENGGEAGGEGKESAEFCFEY